MHHFLSASQTPAALLVSLIVLLLLCVSCAGNSETVAAQSNDVITTPLASATLPFAATIVADATTVVPVPGATTTPTAGAVIVVASTPAVTTTLDGQLPLSHTLNILVLGSDRWPNAQNWRTDVMMIVSLDFAQARVGVISIPRDVYINPIPNHQPNKINVIDYLGERDEPDGGGPKLLKRLIQEHMGITIHHYLRFDHQSFQALVDTLGGVEIEIDCPYADGVINLKAGVQRLTTEQALRYVRSRDLGGDLDRARRQQRFIWAVRNQVLKENLLPRLPALYQSLAGSIQTDIGLVTALRLARFVITINPDNVHSLVLAPPTLLKEGWRQGMFVFIPDWPAIAQATQIIFERPPFVETNTPSVCP
jgi:LCP family protein required for cell wall assembly